MDNQKRKQRIGLLGGSFNPPHAGHLHVSRFCMDVLELDELWWLVSPQNPLKKQANMSHYDHRLALARSVARGDPRIHVSDDERQLGTRYSVDTIRGIQILYPQVNFVWIMGADNLRQLPRWKGWRTLFRTVPIAVFPRAPYSLRALNGRAARCFEKHRLDVGHAKTLVDHAPPAWVFLDVPQHGESSTRLRKCRDQD